MQVYSQTSTSTTLPRSPAAVSGAEFTQRSAVKAGNLPAAPTRHEPARTPKNRSGRMVFIDEPQVAAQAEIEQLHIVGRDHVDNVVAHPRRSIEETASCSLSAQRSEARPNFF